MKVKIYNTLSKKAETIEPVCDDQIGMYSCGLTVYDFAHIGNLRKYVFDDLLDRSLKYFGYKVKWVMNITDVGHLTSDADEGEDKVEKGATREGKSAYDIARFYEKSFLEDLRELKIGTPDVLCRATEHIQEQIDLIKKLESKGFTYLTDDGVYFDTSKVSDYGKLAGLDIENLKEGARVEKNPQKKNPTDFALWKFSASKGADPATIENLARREMEWLSPWGVGFPGWHIECSAMSVKYLGQPFAIHTGGADHIAVHHTNEIAQSEAAEGKPLAIYWVHSEHLLQEGRKMAKSDGHFIRLKDIIDRGFSPLDLRFFYLRAHYRSKIDFSWENLEGAKQGRLRILDFVVKINDRQVEGGDAYFAKVQEEFDQAIADDLDTPKALEVIFNAISHANSNGFFGQGSRKFFENVEKVLAVGLFDEESIERKPTIGKPVKLIGVSDEVSDMAIAMANAKGTKNYEESDRLRKEIVEKGYCVEESGDCFFLRKC